jgi:hypothetical protein
MKDCALLVVGVALVAAMAFGLASIGEPQSSWLVCDIMGFESVCR